MLEILDTYWLALLIGQYPHGPLGGLAATFAVAILSLVLTFPLATLVALARTSRIKPLFYVTTAYVYLIRSVPLLMLLFWVFFAVPLVVGFTLDPFTTLVVAIVVYQAAYLSEVLRGGLLAIPSGQFDAARSLGMGGFDLYARIILPQVIRNVLPGLFNVFVRIIKETSLGYVIGAQELTFTAGLINSYELTKPLEIFGLLAIIYFILCYSLTRLSQALIGMMTTKSFKRRAGDVQ